MQLPDTKKMFICHAHSVNHKGSIFNSSFIWVFFWKFYSQFFDQLSGGNPVGAGIFSRSTCCRKAPAVCGCSVSRLSPVSADCPGHRRLPGHRQRLPAPLSGHSQPAQRKQQVPTAFPVPIQALCHVHGQSGRGDVLLSCLCCIG